MSYYRSVQKRVREYLIGKLLTEETCLPIRSDSQLLTISSSKILSLLCLEFLWKRNSALDNAFTQEIFDKTFLNSFPIMTISVIFSPCQETSCNDGYKVSQDIYDTLCTHPPIYYRQVSRQMMEPKLQMQNRMSKDLTKTIVAEPGVLNSNGCHESHSNNSPEEKFRA